jgi:protein CrcB
MSVSTCLLIMLGGAVGTLVRYLISVLTNAAPHELPWSTIAINVAGSFVIGFFGTLTLASGRLPVSENTRLLVMVGLCGGFTTFSSFSLQTFDLLRNGYITVERGAPSAQHLLRVHVAVLDAAIVNTLQRLGGRRPCRDRVEFVSIENQTGCPSLSL